MRSGISFTLSASDHLGLTALVADRNTPQKHVWRARIVLLSVDGLITESDGGPKPFVWTADPDRIIQAARHGYQVLDSHQ